MLCRKITSMAKSLFLGMTLFLILFLPSSSFADSNIRDAGRKLVRGVVNVSTGWIEIFQGIYDQSVEKGLVTGVLYGPIFGVGMAVIRTGSGLYETVTFPLPFPADYRPTIAPAYVWGKWDFFGGLERFSVSEEPEPP